MKKIISLVLVFSMILSMICTSAIIVSASEKEVVNGSAGKIDVDNSNNKFAYDKTATPLYKNDYTDVTLTVGGEETELDSDVVLILGHRPSENIEYMTQLLNKLNTAVDGTKAKIKLGIVGFSHTTDDEIVLPLTEMKDTVPGNKMADYRFDDRYNDGKQYTESEEDFNKRREEYEAKLLEWEKDELLVTDMEYIIAIALEECERVYGGINLESSLITARDMLMADTDVAPERKHLIAISTGLTYFFDADNGNAATVPVSHNGYLFYSDRTWRYFRNANNNTYPVPVWYNDENGKDDWGKYWQDVLKWIEADQNDYVYTLSQPYNVFAANNNRAAGTLNPNNGRYTYYYAGNSILNPGADDIPGNKIINLPSAAINPTVAGSASAHAFGYERAQYEAYVVFQQMSTKVGEKFTSILKDENGNYIQYDGLGYNCYSVYNPLNYYSTNGYDDTQAAKPLTSWKTGDQYIGHSFMNYLAGGEAPTFSFSSLDWITPIENKVLYSLSEGSKVVDKIGYDEKEGNFDFVDEIDGIQKHPVLTYLGKTYHTTKLETAVDGATYSYTFSEKEGAAPTFRMNYYVGDGKEGEYFEWIFDTNIVKYSNITLTYSLKLTDRSDEDGKHKVNTNQEAKLYPVDSDGKEGAPELFPIPYVEYIVIPEDPTGPNDYNKSKTATPLYDNRYTDVTLSIPGEVEENITDIMFVIDKSSSDVLSGDFANGLFSQLIEVQKATGAAIKVGVVIFNYTSHLWLPLTPLTEDNYQTLMAGLPKLSGGTNADAGLTLAKELLDADTEVDTSRKHVIFISDGLSWVFEKEDTQYTVIAKNQSNGNWYNMYGVGTQPYLSIRAHESWSIPNEFNSWDAFWTNIKTLVENDRNAGDKYLFEMTNHKGEDPTKPLPSELVNTEAGLAVSVPYSEKDNHAMNVERALYESWESYVALQEAGYNCNAYFTGDNGTIGQHFMKMLAGTSSMDFEDIKRDILYSVSKGSKVIDYIGYDPDEDYGYDFDFIDEINGEAKLPVLMVGEKTYHTTKLDAPVGDATASYVFSAKIDGEPTFTMDYFRGDGMTTEHFVWTINEDVSRFAPVSLTYTLDLVDRSEIPGTYDDVDTNQKAILYPVDSDGNDGTPEPFEKPKVEYEVDPVSIVVEKIWDDANNQDGVRPERITIRLYDDQDKEIASKTITANDGWTCEFTGLREYRDGKKINYRITEDTVNDYTTKIEDFVVTNSYTPETIVLEGEKLWDDANDQDGLRPDSIIVNLLADGDVIDSVEVTEDQNGGWNFVFENLPKYRDGGIKIVYEVSEEAVEGYTPSINGTIITNVHTPETVAVEGTKTWDDANDQDGLRPDEITINLLADGNIINTITVTSNDWSWSFENLPKYRDGGVEIVYSITEETVEGYETVVDGYNVTNTHTPETTVVEGAKTWDDANDQDGLRPDEITINLLADDKIIETITVTSNDWSWSFDNLPKYRDGGVEIVYSITEEKVDGYETVVDGYNVTNKHTPETTIVDGEKLWDDANDQDGLRPDSIIINLIADGDVIDSVEVTEDQNGDWKFSFENLPKYRDGGIEIVYEVAEEAVDGYEAAVNGTIVVNKHVPETVVVEGNKTWDDNDDQDGIRPQNITINLLSDGTIIRTLIVTEADNWSWKIENLPKYRDGGIEIVYTITEKEVEGYESTIYGYNVTNKHVPATGTVEGTKTWDDANNQDGIRPERITINLLADNKVVKTITVTEADGWSWKFDELPIYRDGGIEIIYSISEEAVEGYTTEYEGFNVINKYAPEKTNVEVLKIWDDNDDQDGLRPDEITIKLLANGEYIRSAVLTKETSWSYNFTDLDKYEAGVEIVYTIEEIAVDGYETTIDGYTVTNKHIPETTVVEGNKTWVDADDQDGIRPDEITINLKADGEVIETITVTADDWSWSFDNLPKYRDGGVEIVYSITEDKVEGYIASYDGFNVTNTHTPATVVVEGNKTWDDNDDQDGIRPESITINLLANDEVIDTITVTEADEWKWSFTGLAKFEAGEEITYSITEEKVDGYETTIDGYNVTNKHVPATVVVEGNKTWDDNDDQDGIRPESITINLLANGEVVETITVTAADWSWTFENLPKFEAGEEITYSITEEKVDGYETTIDGYNVTNKHVPATVVVEGEKIWDDNDDQDGLRPDEITINLLANGEVVDTVKVTEADDWKFIFENLPKFEAGEEITYTIEEVKVDGYEASYDGYIVTNTHAPETISVKVDKIWDDDDNSDELRPESITVHLYADGVKVATKVITADDNWSWTFENLAKYNAGEEIVYTVSEDAVEEYETAIEGNAADGFVITNTHYVDIPEESTPLAPPVTGDKSITALLIMSITSLLLGAIVATKRKREI
ncbi:MAG: Cna B-type domain-containing protein [Clostridia bacterium]|nr:Cna B-type domain-containing protein [Clostridia bacterium]